MHHLTDKRARSAARSRTSTSPHLRTVHMALTIYRARAPELEATYTYTTYTTQWEIVRLSSTRARRNCAQASAAAHRENYCATTAAATAQWCTSPKPLSSSSAAAEAAVRNSQQQQLQLQPTQAATLAKSEYKQIKLDGGAESRVRLSRS